MQEATLDALHSLDVHVEINGFGPVGLNVLLAQIFVVRVTSRTEPDFRGKELSCAGTREETTISKESKGVAEEGELHEDWYQPFQRRLVSDNLHHLQNDAPSANKLGRILMYEKLRN